MWIYPASMHHMKISLHTKEGINFSANYPNEGAPPSHPVTPVTPKETYSGRLVVLLSSLVIMEWNKAKFVYKAQEITETINMHWNKRN